MIKWTLTDTLGREEVYYLPEGNMPFLHDHVVNVESEEAEEHADNLVGSFIRRYLVGGCYYAWSTVSRGILRWRLARARRTGRSVDEHGRSQPV